VILFFPLLRMAEPWAVIFAMAFPGAILQPMSLAVSGSFYPERFSDPRLRFSGVSLGAASSARSSRRHHAVRRGVLVRSAGGSLTWGAHLLRGCLALRACAVISSRETAAILELVWSLSLVFMVPGPSTSFVRSLSSWFL
jgi:hypothetical protein